MRVHRRCVSARGPDAVARARGFVVCVGGLAALMVLASFVLGWPWARLQGEFVGVGVL